MALRHAILAALISGESSGYDLAKSFDVAVANYWTATAQQLYRELDRLADAGLVTGRTVEQEKRPNKRVYSLTDAGREALRAFVASDPKPTAIRDELLVQLEAMQPDDVEEVKAHVSQKLADSRRKLEYYRRSRDFLLDGKSEDEYLAHQQRLGRYLTLARGLSFEEENVRWCEFTLKALASQPKT